MTDLHTPPSDFEDQLEDSAARRPGPQCIVDRPPVSPESTASTLIKQLERTLSRGGS
jgi:hypothetical protein